MSEIIVSVHVNAPSIFERVLVEQVTRASVHLIQEMLLREKSSQLADFKRLQVQVERVREVLRLEWPEHDPFANLPLPRL